VRALAPGERDGVGSPVARGEMARARGDRATQGACTVRRAEVAARELVALASRSRYGVPGDRLWVKETHGVIGVEDDAVRVANAAEPGRFTTVRLGPEALAWVEARVDLDRRQITSF
jgi:hypothetical protein